MALNGLKLDLIYMCCHAHICVYAYMCVCVSGYLFIVKIFQSIVRCW